MRLRRGDESGGDVREAHGGLDLVHVLSALAAGTVGVAPEFRLRDDDVRLDEIGEFGDGVHAGEAGVAAFVRVEGGDAHEPVNAALGLAETIGVLALDAEGHALQAGGIARERVGDFPLPAAAVEPAAIHAREHFRPVLRLGAAGAGVDAEDAVAPVMRAVEEDTQFE